MFRAAGSSSSNQRLPELCIWDAGDVFRPRLMDDDSGGGQHSVAITRRDAASVSEESKWISEDSLIQKRWGETDFYFFFGRRSNAERERRSNAERERRSNAERERRSNAERERRSNVERQSPALETYHENTWRKRGGDEIREVPLRCGEFVTLAERSNKEPDRSLRPAAAAAAAAALAESVQQQPQLEGELPSLFDEPIAKALRKEPRRNLRVPLSRVGAYFTSISDLVEWPPIILDVRDAATKDLVPPRKNLYRLFPITAPTPPGAATDLPSRPKEISAAEIVAKLKRDAQERMAKAKAEAEAAKKARQAAAAAPREKKAVSGGRYML